MPAATIRDLPMALHVERVQRGARCTSRKSCLGPVLLKVFMIGCLVLVCSLLLLRG